MKKIILFLILSSFNTFLNKAQAQTYNLEVYKECLRTSELISMEGMNHVNSLSPGTYSRFVFVVTSVTDPLYKITTRGAYPALQTPDGRTMRDHSSPSCAYVFYYGNEVLNNINNIEKTIEPVCKAQIAQGSEIDFDKKTVIEFVPITGTDFFLSYSSQFNPHSNYNKRFSIDYNIADFSEEEIIGHGYHLETKNLDVDSTYTASVPSSSDSMNFQTESELNWSQINSPIQTQNLEISLRTNTSAPAVEPHAVSCSSLPLHERGYAGCNASTPIPPNPSYATYENSFLLSVENKKIALYNPAFIGLKGWTVSLIHYFDATSKTLFHGNGRKIEYRDFKTISVSEYPESVNLVINQQNGEEVYVFDEDGRHLETRHAILGYTIHKFNYDVNGKISSVEDRFEKQTQFVYDGNGDISQIIAPYGQVTHVTSNTNTITQVTDPLNKSYSMVYDSDRQLTNFTSVNGVETVFSYKTNGDFLSETKNIGIIQTFAEQLVSGFKEQIHNLNFGVLKKISVRNFKEHTETRSYDSENRLRSTTKQYYHTNTEEHKTASTTATTSFAAHPVWADYFYLNSQSTLVDESSQQITQNNSQSKSSNYSSSGNPLTLTTYQQQNYINGRRIQLLQYNRSAQTITHSDNYVSSSAQLNSLGQITRIESNLSHPVDFTYNTHGQLTRVQKGDHFEDYIYNNAGNLISSTNSDNQTLSYTYDANSRLIEKTLPNTEKIKFEYTDGGEIKKITTPSNQEHLFQLGLGDYLQNYLTPNNHKTKYFYDSDKRLTKIKKPSGRKIQYSYKTNSEYLSHITTDNGQITIHEIDAESRLKGITSDDGIKTEIDWAGTLVQGQTWYDTDNSVIAHLAFNFKSDEFVVQNIKLNNQTVATYNYNNLGKISNINGNSYGYQIHDFTEFINISNMGFNISYQRQDNLNEVMPTVTVQANAQDDDITPISIQMTRSFDTFGQATQISNLVIDTNYDRLHAYSELKPEYDANNRLIQIQKNRRQLVNDQEVSSTDHYNQYDFPIGSNNNLKEFRHQADLNSPPQKRTIATHSNDDRLLTLRGSVNRDYAYNADGDLKSMTNCYGTTQYEYDVFSNLKKVTFPSGKIIEYKVDALNRRVKKLENSVVKEYYLWYDQTRIAAILDENKNPKLVYIYGPESAHSPSYVIKNGVSYRILHDPGLGSIRYVINPSTRQIAQEIEYDEYGNMTKNTDPEFQPLTFAGGLWDSDTKLIRFGARDYDPTVGRWTTKDPIGFAGGDTNLYAYVGNNPMSYNDPSGLFALEFGGTLGAFFGGGFGLGGAAAGSGAITFDNANPRNIELGTTVSGQARPLGVGASAGAGGYISFTPFANNINDLAGGFGGFGFDIGFLSGSVTFSSAGPTFSLGAGLGIPSLAAYTVGGYQSSQLRKRYPAQCPQK